MKRAELCDILVRIFHSSVVNMEAVAIVTGYGQSRHHADPL